MITPVLPCHSVDEDLKGSSILTPVYWNEPKNEWIIPVCEGDGLKSFIFTEIGWS